MAIVIADQFNLEVSKAMDDRLILEDTSTLYSKFNNLNSYLGMMVFVEDENSYYSLTKYNNDGDADSECWIKILSIDGEADTSVSHATNADYATSDSSGQSIIETYIKNITSTSNGAISFTKGDDSSTNVTVYTHPSYTAQTSGLYKITVDSTGHVSGVTAVEKSDITDLGIAGSDTTYNVFTTTDDGLVPAPTSANTDKYLRGDGTWVDLEEGFLSLSGATIEDGAYVYFGEDNKTYITSGEIGVCDINVDTINAHCGTTLTITPSTTISSSLTVSGSSTFNNNMTITSMRKVATVTINDYGITVDGGVVTAGLGLYSNAGLYVYSGDFHLTGGGNTILTGNATIYGTLAVYSSVNAASTVKSVGGFIGDLTGNADTATKLATARTIGLSGAATGTATSFDGSANITIPVTELDATKLTGTVPIESIPQAALERLVIVENAAARYALTTDDVQLGDTVKEQDTGYMYYVVDESKLDSDEGYEVYTAGSASSVAWTGITGKPDTFTPSEHTHSTDDITSGTLPVTRGGTGNSSVDTTPTSGSTKMVTSGGVYTALSGKADTSHSHSTDDITSGTLPVTRGGTGNTSVDSTPTSGSSKMVTSDGIYNALANKADSSDLSSKADASHTHSASDITSGTLPVTRGGTGNTSVDTTPTSGSTKMVTSGGVYTALASKADSSHSHTKSDITDFPDSLKNPNALSIKVNGNTTTYDGSSAESVTITIEDVTIDIDDALSTTSTNAVQNKVVTEALNNEIARATAAESSLETKISTVSDSISSLESDFESKVDEAIDIANEAKSAVTTANTNITNLQTTVETHISESSTKISSIESELDGKADASHTHSASDITSGTLSVSRGGTGNSSVDSTPTSGSSKMVTSDGVYTALSGKADATHTHSASDITSGTLPVTRGGTGNTSVDTTPTSGSTKMVTSGGVYTALTGKADSSHTHTKSEVTDFPDSLKNPNALTINVNGTSTIYDGSAAKTVTLTIDESGSVDTDITIDVDSALSTTSENPVQNKVVTEALNNKADASHTHSASDITSGTLPVTRGGTGNTSVDTTPTSGSTKMVTSGGVYTALSGKADSSHTHSASDITSGTLPVTRGGTGNTSVDTTPTSGSTKMVTSGGVYTALSGKADSSHTHSASDITSGTLPVTRGGTGNTSVDTTPTSGSTKMVTSGGVYTALSGKADSSHTHTKSNITDFPDSLKNPNALTITVNGTSTVYDGSSAQNINLTIDENGSTEVTIEVDSALSTTSTNPVQNKVVTAALNNKADSSDIPSSLKNPNALTIKVDGVSTTYDGSSAKTVTIASGSQLTEYPAPLYKTVSQYSSTLTSQYRSDTSEYIFDSSAAINDSIVFLYNDQMVSSSSGLTVSSSAESDDMYSTALDGTPLYDSSGSVLITLPEGISAFKLTSSSGYLAEKATYLGTISFSSSSSSSTSSTVSLTSDVTGILPIANGGTGASTASTARSNLGLGTAATRSYTSSVSSSSTALVTSSAVYNALSSKVDSSALVGDEDYVLTGTGDSSEWREPIIKNLAGETVSTTSTTTATAGTNATIINDLRSRTFSSTSVSQGNVASGNYSFAQGGCTTASGGYSHAEGYRTIASSSGAHAEGYNTTASGAYSHTEGYNTKASASYSHAEGYSSTASVSYAHAEGRNTTASGNLGSHAEGYSTEASGNYTSHAEGYSTIASGNYGSHAEGNKTTASSSSAHAEGYSTEASGNYGSHAEGYSTEASGDYGSHAEGNKTTASSSSAHAEGLNTTASATSAHAEGRGTVANGASAHAGGHYTTANNMQTAIGKYNKSSSGPSDEDSTTGDLFIVGNGTSSATSNAFRVSTAGVCYAGSSVESTGADFAEYFEWEDGNTENEDRRGLFVTSKGEQIRIANSDDEYILGVVSATPTITGDSQSEIWKDMYMRDIFGEIVTETVTVEEYTDEEVGEVIPEHEVIRYVLNPEYDNEQTYVSRDQRPEWAPVGLIGKLIVVDDGTCEVDGYCKVADGGIATKADTGYRVMSRLDDTHIRILLK